MFFKNILNYVYPNVCGLCGKSLKSNTYTCTICKGILKYYKEKHLINCAGRYYEEVLSLYKYDGIIKKKICQFKFRNQKYLGSFFGYLLSNKLKELKIEFDIIIPVPINFIRYMERGYNQSFLIAKEISKIMKKELCNNVLFKFKRNKRQSELHMNDRKNNVIGVYKTKNENEVNGKIILLVDDIYTTGSTIDECAKMLKKAGAKKVIAITIAYA